MRILALLSIATLFALAALGPASAGPLDCRDAPCTISARLVGYVTPVATVGDGGSVIWASADSTHIQVDGVTPGDSAACMQVTTGAASPSDEVRFDIIGDQLVATTNPGTQFASAAVCPAAMNLEDGSKVLPYWCALHPNMRGTLVVTPQL